MCSYLLIYPHVFTHSGSGQIRIDDGTTRRRTAAVTSSALADTVSRASVLFDGHPASLIAFFSETHCKPSRRMLGKLMKTDPPWLVFMGSNTYAGEMSGFGRGLALWACVNRGERLPFVVFLANDKHNWWSESRNLLLLKFVQLRISLYVHTDSKYHKYPA
jgi:hypothetical protein